MVIIDYGSASAKVLQVFEKPLSLRVAEVPLGFDIAPRPPVARELERVLAAAGISAKDRGEVFVSGEVASLDFKKILAQPPLDPRLALDALGLPIVDLGFSLTYCLGKVSRALPACADILTWLPFRMDAVDLEDYLANREIFCQSIPATPRDLAIEQAIAREKLRMMRGEPNPASEEKLSAGQILLSGAVFSKAGEASQAILVALDGLQPRGVCRFFLDTRQILPALGALKHFRPASYEKAAVDDRELGIVGLGTTVGVVGPLRVCLDAGMREPLEIEVEEDSLFRFPLGEGEKAKVVVKPSVGEPLEVEVEGGLAGLVIDGRDYPLGRPRTDHHGRERLRRWDKILGAHGQVKEI